MTARLYVTVHYLLLIDYTNIVGSHLFPLKLRHFSARRNSAYVIKIYLTCTHLKINYIQERPNIKDGVNFRNC